MISFIGCVAHSDIRSLPTVYVCIVPPQVVWHTVISGLFLQFMFGLFVLRWKKGFQAAEFLGNQTVVFLEYTIAGSEFIFGEEWYIHGFVMYVSILKYAVSL